MCLITAIAAHAGVVIEQDQTQTAGTNIRSLHQTVMVQGNKQRLVSEKRTVITDLDAGKVYMLDEASKSYRAMNFPPSHGMGKMQGQAPSALEYKKTGKSLTIADFKCDEYTGAGSLMTGDYSVTECFSTTAPGADEFSAYAKKAAAAVKDSPMGGLLANVPAGIPLQLDSTVKIGKFNMTNLPPDQAEKIRKMLENRPPVVMKTVVKSIAVKDLPKSTFEPPSDFKERAMPSMAQMGGMGHGMPGPGMMGKPGMPPAAMGAPGSMGAPPSMGAMGAPAAAASAAPASAPSPAQ
jgi:hypothetical protein